MGLDSFGKNSFVIMLEWTKVSVEAGKISQNSVGSLLDWWKFLHELNVLVEISLIVGSVIQKFFGSGWDWRRVSGECQDLSYWNGQFVVVG